METENKNIVLIGAFVDEINKTSQDNNENILWKDDGMKIKGPFPEIDNMAVMQFSGDKENTSLEENKRRSKVETEIAENIRPQFLEIFIDFQPDKIIVLIPKGCCLEEILSRENTREKEYWNKLYATEIKKGIYTENVTPKDFWACESNKKLYLIHTKNLKLK